MTYGPGKTVRHGKMSALSGIIDGGYAGRVMSIEQGGDQKADLHYHKDVLWASTYPAWPPKLRYDAYNIASGEGYTLKDIAGEVKRIIPTAGLKSDRGSISLEGLPTITVSIISPGPVRTWIYAKEHPRRCGGKPYPHTQGDWTLKGKINRDFRQKL
jgi:nucleoside-diphosphate-sugar epimerase